MRIRHLVRSVGYGLPLAWAVFVGSARGQFRELIPESNSPRVARQDLSPTRQKFIAPRATTKPVADQPTLAPPPPTVAPAAPGESAPTPAVPLVASLPKPATATPPTSGTVVANPLSPSITVPTPQAPIAAPTLDASTAAIGVGTPATLASPAVTAPASSAAVATPAASPVIDPTLSATTPPSAATPPAAVTNPFANFQHEVAQQTAIGPTAPQPAIVAGPVTFNQVVPGATTTTQLQAQWGTPATSVVDERGAVLVYRVPGFQQIDVHIDPNAQIVESILVHLTEPLASPQIIEHLGLQAIRPVVVTDEVGGRLGQAYPERGVLLTWADASEQVTHIVLEPIRAELFRLRAETDRSNRCTLDLADLDQALKLSPQDAHAHWLRAELLSSLGRSQDARDSADAAIRNQADNPLYQLTQARLTGETGNLLDALTATRAVAEQATVPTIVRARAEYQWGNLLAVGPDPNFQEALNHHLKAIDLASKYVSQPQVDMRRMAKDILVDAHLALAQDIALGNFQRQREVVPKWLTRATELAEDLVTKDQGDPTTRMEVYRSTLAVYSILDGNFDASVATEEAIREGQRLISEVSDRAYQQRVEHELSETLYHAAKIEHRCGRTTTAMQYANNAIVLAEAGQDLRQPSLFDRVMTGQLYFFTGSLYAVNSQDHAEAVRWYEKAMPAFDEERIVDLVDASAFGDLFVSMGVSYWEVGQKEKAIELTQAGAELMQQGVQSGALDMAVLSVPYGNLSVMHQQLGNGEQAQHFASMVAKIENETKANVKR